ncbi:Hypothetical protein CINCED_3A013793 [Cinara cedri]|uniref:Uncharacterized protein n=1 Tax=Cinara cedri TaxID=506608 RepID=A0A5E4MMS5_9HEMI|nr:Hypothetical protein CINCED_3A013793 [Cinara cedri]
MFNVLESIYTHFSLPKKNKILDEFQMNLGLSERSISKICDTRWICRYKTCNAIKTNFKAIVRALRFENNESADKDATQYIILITFETVIDILSSIEKASFVVHMFVLNDVLIIIYILSNQLQKKTEPLGNEANLINGVITSFENNRSDEYVSIL